MTDSFSALHPALTFCYFAAVLLLTMFVLHPVFLALSLLGALGYCAQLRGWRSLWRTLGRLVPFLVLMAALNALFNHAGVTMLFYLPNGNPIQFVRVHPQPKKAAPKKQNQPRKAAPKRRVPRNKKSS